MSQTKRAMISLRKFNTFQLDSACPTLLIVHKESELDSFFGCAPHEYYLLGEGSNIVMMPQLSRPVIKMEIKGKEIIHDTGDEVILRIGAGENWHQLVLWTIENGLFGLENLSLIPGSVGAAPVQNIGAYGVELVDSFVRCEGVHLPEGKNLSINRTGARLAYRDSIFKHELKGKVAITHVHLKLSRTAKLKLDYGDLHSHLKAKGIFQPSPKDVSNAVIEIRTSKLPDPTIIGNAGSFFKNPVVSSSHFDSLKISFPNIPAFHLANNQVKIPAAWLIQEAGFKGIRKGNVGTHTQQALVIVNYGNGSAPEIILLADEIRASVQKMFGIELEQEVHIWS
ncbi:MAG: UDP-N-acetylmuramate dehydrogenase [Saprospiraceae bacterium]|nr:UDP-N-acetylmuramate dehydrogenase [Saprospiraceae bacterium]